MERCLSRLVGETGCGRSFLAQAFNSYHFQVHGKIKPEAGNHKVQTK